MRLHIVLISDSKKVTKGQLYSLIEPLQENLLHGWTAWRDLLPHWMAGAPPSVVVWDDKPLPTWGDVSSDMGRCCPMYFVDDLSRNPKTLAVHYVQGNRPSARVYVEAASSLNGDRHSLMTLAGHEALELMGNPWIEQWHPVPGRPNELTLQELCDAVQDTYHASTDDPQGKPWLLANWLRPRWFGLPDSPHVNTFDHAGRLGEAGELGKHGYLLLRDDDWNVRQELGGAYDGQRAISLMGKKFGRTREAVRRCTLSQRARMNSEALA